MLHAVVHQRINFIGFVEYGIDPQQGTAGPYIGRGVVAENHHALVWFTLLAGREHTEAAALAQEEIHDGDVPFPRIGRKPCGAFCFCFGNAHGFNFRKLSEGVDEVLSDRGVVFYDVCAQFHSV